MNSIFVTGGGGYLGRHVLPQLPGARALLRRPPDSSFPTGVEVVRGDLLEPSSYSRALVGVDTVLHMAAATGKCKRSEYFRVNVEGTRALVEASRKAGVRRFVFVSSIAVKFQDTARYYYAQSKRQAEEIVAASGFEYTLVRPTLILGPGAPGLVSLSKLAAAPVIPVFGNGKARLQPIHVKDLASVLVNLVTGGQKEASIIEAGGPDAISMEDLLLRLRASLGKGRAAIWHVPAAPFAAVLGLLEPFFLPLMPVTAGQLASFTNDGVVEGPPRGQIPLEGMV